MTPTFIVGDTVRTPLGKGVVRQLRNNGRLLVEIDGRAVVVDASTIRPLEQESRKNRKADKRSPGLQVHDERPTARSGGELDLHGLTVEEALSRAEWAINEALLDDHAQLRLIHGRSGGRIRAALHRRLRAISAVRAFRIDPRNEGVTIVVF